MAILALLVLAALVAFHSLNPFTATWDQLNPKPDDAMRIVEMRDLAEGQGWFDLRQMRLGADAPVEMHWSRLVDLPLLLIRLAAETVVTPDQADRAAAAIWPFCIAFAWVFLMLRIAGQLAGPRGASLAFLLVAPFSLIEIELRPGRVDHHELQLVMLLLVLSLAIAGRERPALAAGAGIATAASAGIGLETLPMLAVPGIGLATAWALGGAGDLRRAAAAYGLGLAGGTVGVLLATAPRRALIQPLCDQLSLATGSLLVLAGAGLATGVVLAGPRALRIAAVLTLGAAAVALISLAFPHCLAGPYGTLSPEMQEAMKGTIERKGIFESLAQDPDLALYRYVVRPAIGIAGLALGLWLVPARHRFGLLLFLATAAFATLIAMVEERGHRVAQSLVLVGGALLLLWVTRWRGPARLAMPFALAALLVVMTPVGYAFLPSTAEILRSDAQGAEAGAIPGLDPGVAGLQRCVADAEMAPLAALPPGRVLTHPTVGNYLLLKTPHASIGGMLHRNGEGFVGALRMQRADAETGHALLSRYRADYFVFCAFQGMMEGMAGTLFADLVAGKVPPWLTPLPGGERLRVYRFTPRLEQGAATR